jgi:hypothetical protein
VKTQRERESFRKCKHPEKFSLGYLNGKKMKASMLEANQACTRVIAHHVRGRVKAVDIDATTSRP